MGCGCCLLAGIGAFVPRIVLLFLWLFTEFVDRAFTNWFAPLVGLLILPYTTLMYVAVYSPGHGGVSGFGWFLVIVAFLFDLGNYTGGIAGRGRRMNDFYGGWRSA